MFPLVQNSSLPCFRVRGDTLQKCQGIAHSVRLVSRQCGWIYRWIDVHDLLIKNRIRRSDTQSVTSNTTDESMGRGSHLQQSSNGATGVPEHGRQVRHRFPFLAQLQQRVLSGLRTGQLIDPLVDLLPVHLGQSCHISHSLWNKGVNAFVVTSQLTPNHRWGGEIREEPNRDLIAEWKHDTESNKATWCSQVRMSKMVFNSLKPT